MIKRFVFFKNRGGGDLFSRLRQGFTLGELSIVLVVMTLVVMVTLPITLSKMKKVDYISYWMGYELMKNISANINADSFLEEDDDDCVIELSDGTCFSAAFAPDRLTKSECEASKTTLGIEACDSNIDCWAGAVKACGGVSKMPTVEQLAEIANYIYNTSGIGANSYDTNLTMDTKKAEEYGITFSESSQGLYFLLYSGHEYDEDSMIGRSFYSTWTSTFNSLRSCTVLGAVLAVCMTKDKDDEDDNNDTYTRVLCERLEQVFNTNASDCSVPASSVHNGIFKNLTPHIELSNGLKLYIGSDFEEIDELSDAEDENDRIGFVVYIDVNGKSGKSILWEDVFPFYLLKSGKVIAAYNESSPSGGNNMEHLKVNVVYDDYSGPNRALKLLMKDANFRSAACAVGYIKSSKYCDGKVQYDLCKDTTRDCRMMVKEPIKIF